MSFLDTKPGVPLLESDDLVRHYDVNRGLANPVPRLRHLMAFPLRLKPKRLWRLLGNLAAGNRPLVVS